MSVIKLKIIERFVALIYEDYGKEGVKKALAAIEGHIEHRRKQNHL